MAKKRDDTIPAARRDGLIVESLPDEVLVYDTERHKAHCLNRTAALVWEHCDGQVTVGDLARRLTQTLQTPVDQRVVWLAVEQLGKAHLLTESPQPQPGLSRRDLLKRLGVAAAVALPLVTTIVSPGASEAASCIAEKDPCTPGGTPCCPPQNCIDFFGSFECR